ncbi:5'-AMP-activated protein kinase subunit beta-2 [Eurytemora carolleeae]|uniref:5'-AMP-activated protein kinase subunit beta-2 n=1 Tax=Eurytemora carolleeae TaxID=1294199 RepID=UPI000C774682|nr:5'-AMP-activated protein kinase subunit beta-2 [Eurytemora carolleeae]|eukprot:XP_023319513.1 5'-AMP-activated protein kinase subunit beta-2-like [Eurytemora affinis]
MGNANTHERRKSGLPDTGLSIEDIRSPPALTIGEKPKKIEAESTARKKTPPPSFETTVTDKNDKIEEAGSPNEFRRRAGTMGEDKTTKDLTSNRLPTIIKYPGTGKDVYVCGTFSDWKKIPMVKSQKDFVALIDLPVGEHQYKFVVDDEWIHDPAQPSVKSDVSGKNNVIKIHQDDFDAFSALDMDSRSTNSRHRRGGEQKFGQDIPSVHSFENKAGPPILPPHLLQVILNKDTPLSCEPTLLPEPNHVMINHLYALSIKDGVMVISSTQRYRKKYVTTLLYKPIEGAA